MTAGQCELGLPQAAAACHQQRVQMPATSVGVARGLKAQTAQPEPEEDVLSTSFYGFLDWIGLTDSASSAPSSPERTPAPAPRTQRVVPYTVPKPWVVQSSPPRQTTIQPTLRGHREVQFPAPKRWAEPHLPAEHRGWYYNY